MSHSDAFDIFASFLIPRVCELVVNMISPLERFASSGEPKQTGAAKEIIDIP